MTTTYMNRATTNEEVFRQANSHIAANHFEAKILPIQDILTHRRIALAAKILRQGNDSPMRMVNFKRDTAAPIEVAARASWWHGDSDSEDSPVVHQSPRKTLRVSQSEAALSSLRLEPDTPEQRLGLS
eukprot:s2062_g2.t1